MISYDTDNPARIQHFIKVHSFARIIGTAEGLDAKTLFTLEAAAVIHDIGIKKAEEQFGRCDGPLQEKLGPPEADILLRACDLSEETVQRACWLCAHHHTYHPIEGIDHQILIEADFLVNLYEGGEPEQTIYTVYHNIFRTNAGKMLCRELFGIKE